MRKFFYLTIVLLLFQNGLLKAQKIWTLDDCIQYAVTNNLDVKNLNLQNKINKENFSQSKRDLLPDLSGSFYGSRSFGRSLDYDTYEYVNTSQDYSSSGISSGVYLFQGFIKRNTISLQKMNYLAGMENEQQQKYDVAFLVLEAYYNAVYYHGLIEIVKEQKELSVLNLKETKEKVDLGLKAKSDLLEMESELAKEELTLIQTQNHYNAAILDLKQAMNIITDEEITIDFTSNEVGISVENTSPSQIYNTAIQFNPTIKAKAFLKDKAAKNLLVTKGGLWPTLYLGGDYSTYYSHQKGSNSEAFFTQFKNNANQSLGLSLSIPIFDKFGTRSDIKIAKLSYLQAETTYEKTKQELFNVISDNYQELKSYYSEYQQLVKQVDYAEAAYNVAEKKLSQGIISIIEMYTSKNTLAKAKSDLLLTELQYRIKKKTIDYYLGKPVFGFQTTINK